MLRMLYPCEYVESVFSIDYLKIYKLGYRGLIFDIDNTLVHHGEDATSEIEELFRTLQCIGFKTLLLTNNDESRTKRFKKNIDSLYLCDANKPNTENYIKAVNLLGMQKNQVLFIGDQVFTDIYGANRSGIDNILVRYLRYENETKIGIKRMLEKLILKLYSFDKACQNRIGDIGKAEDV